MLSRTPPPPGNSLVTPSSGGITSHWTTVKMKLHTLFRVSGRRLKCRCCSCRLCCLCWCCCCCCCFWRWRWIWRCLWRWSFLPSKLFETERRENVERWGQHDGSEVAIAAAVEQLYAVVQQLADRRTFLSAVWLLREISFINTQVGNERANERWNFNESDRLDTIPASLQFQHLTYFLILL